MNLTLGPTGTITRGPAGTITGTQTPDRAGTERRELDVRTKLASLSDARVVGRFKRRLNPIGFMCSRLVPDAARFDWGAARAAVRNENLSSVADYLRETDDFVLHASLVEIPRIFDADIESHLVAVNPQWSLRGVYRFAMKVLPFVKLIAAWFPGASIVTDALERVFDQVKPYLRLLPTEAIRFMRDVAVDLPVDVSIQDVRQFTDRLSEAIHGAEENLFGLQHIMNRMQHTLYVETWKSFRDATGLKVPQAYVLQAQIVAFTPMALSHMSFYTAGGAAEQWGGYVDPRYAAARLLDRAPDVLRTLALRKLMVAQSDIFNAELYALVPALGRLRGDGDPGERGAILDSTYPWSYKLQWWSAELARGFTRASSVLHDLSGLLYEAVERKATDDAAATFQPDERARRLMLDMGVFTADGSNLSAAAKTAWVKNGTDEDTAIADALADGRAIAQIEHHDDSVSRYALAEVKQVAKAAVERHAARLDEAVAGAWYTRSTNDPVVALVVRGLYETWRLRVVTAYELGHRDMALDLVEERAPGRGEDIVRGALDRALSRVTVSTNLADEGAPVPGAAPASFVSRLDEMHDAWCDELKLPRVFRALYNDDAFREAGYVGDAIETLNSMLARAAGAIDGVATARRPGWAHAVRVAAAALDIGRRETLRVYAGVSVARRRGGIYAIDGRGVNWARQAWTAALDVRDWIDVVHRMIAAHDAGLLPEATYRGINLTEHDMAKFQMGLTQENAEKMVRDSIDEVQKKVAESIHVDLADPRQILAAGDKIREQLQGLLTRIGLWTDAVWSGHRAAVEDDWVRAISVLAAMFAMRQARGAAESAARRLTDPADPNSDLDQLLQQGEVLLAANRVRLAQDDISAAERWFALVTAWITGQETPPAVHNGIGIYSPSAADAVRSAQDAREEARVAFLQITKALGSSGRHGEFYASASRQWAAVKSWGATMIENWFGYPLDYSVTTRLPGTTYDTTTRYDDLVMGPAANVQTFAQQVVWNVAQLADLRVLGWLDGVETNIAGAQDDLTKLAALRYADAWRPTVEEYAASARQKIAQAQTGLADVRSRIAGGALPSDAATRSFAYNVLSYGVGASRDANQALLTAQAHPFVIEGGPGIVVGGNKIVIGEGGGLDFGGEPGGTGERISNEGEVGTSSDAGGGGDMGTLLTVGLGTLALGGLAYVFTRKKQK